MQKLSETELDRMWKAVDRRYINGIFAVPRKPKSGRVLVHNHIAHTKDMSNGVNGFRFWTQKPNPKLVVRCKCGWGGIEHYHVKGVGSHKSFTRKQLEARLGHPLWD
jgi:hypothetical protein